MKKISIAIPVYNEQDNILLAYNTVLESISELTDKYDFEFIFTDNHSSDNTFSILKDLAQKDSRVKVARLSRNFGYQKSIYTGYLLTSGDAVIQLDVDLQDPPSIIPEFIEQWEKGYSVVYGVRIGRKESFVLQGIRKLFYRLIDFLSEDQLPHDAGDFRLVDKRIIEEMRKLYDYSPYLRGMIASMGFNQIGIPYHRNERLHGKSKFNVNSLFRLAFDGIINHSIVPLRLATFFGFLIFTITVFAMGAYTLLRILYFPSWPAGFTTITVLILISLGMNALFLGIIGEYLGRLYQQTKGKPLTITEKTINL